ncbi:MAG TPA: RDD family protein [Candidatus Binatia bacterium]|nr:RDD family protein [Candidatus Binatia bacterium]
MPAPLWRRLAAAAYDALLLAALITVIAALDQSVRLLLDLPRSFAAMRAFALLGCLLFCGGFWVHGGATPGMRAWHLAVRRENGAPLRWPTACARFAWSLLAWLPLGAGLLLAAFDAQGRALHDRLSGTRVVLDPRR